MVTAIYILINDGKYEFVATVIYLLLELIAGLAVEHNHSDNCNEQ